MRTGNLAWAILATFTLSTGALQPNAFAQNSDGLNLNDNTQADRALDDRRVDEIALATSDTNALVTKIVIVTRDCVFRADTDNIRRRNVNRVGIVQDIPVLGVLFGNTPRQGDFTPGNQIGLAYFASDIGPAIFVDLRPAEGLPNVDVPTPQDWLIHPPSGQSAPFALNSAGPPLVGASVINRNFQFLIPAAYFKPSPRPCSKDANASLTALGPFFPKPVGTVYLFNSQMNILIKPSIVAGY